MMRNLFLLAIFLLTISAFSSPNPVFEFSGILQGEGEINKKDNLGRKQGQWIIKGK